MREDDGLVEMIGATVLGVGSERSGFRVRGAIGFVDEVFYP